MKGTQIDRREASRLIVLGFAGSFLGRGLSAAEETNSSLRIGKGALVRYSDFSFGYKEPCKMLGTTVVFEYRRSKTDFGGLVMENWLNLHI